MFPGRTLVICTAVLVGAVAPASHAANFIQIDQSQTFPFGGDACVAVHTGGGPEGDSKCTHDLTFDEGASISVGSAHHTSSIVDSPGGVLVDAVFAAQASRTETTGGVAGSLLTRKFIINTVGVPYKITGNSSVSSDGATHLTLLRECPGGGCDVVEKTFESDENGSFSFSGTLPPASERYRLDLDSGCGPDTVGSSCTANADIRVEFGDPAPSVVIGSGPSGLVASRTARFEFTTTDPNPPPGSFQCRVDGQADFTDCSSPVDLANLSDGQHTFRVRYDPDDGAPSPATERTWTVDATAPSVTFDSAPSGDQNGSTAQIAFHSSEPTGATFRCKLDSNPEFDCVSPQSLSGLSDGPHTFSVTTTDQAGNVSLPATASWTVSPPEGPVDVGCTDAGASAGFGPVRLVARTADACFVDDNVGGSPVRVSRGQVTLNGITLTPAPGTRIIVAPGLGDGTVTVDGPVTVVFGPPPKPGEDPIDVTLPRLDLPGLGTTASVANKLVSLGEGSPLAIAGLKVAPAMTFEFAPDNGGQLKVTFRLGLPNVFKPLPDSNDGVTVEFSPTFSNDRGVTFGGRIKIARTYLFGQEVKDLDLAYDHGTGIFDGSLGIKLGERVLTGSISISVQDLDLNCGLRKIGLVASSIDRPIGPGVFLQRFGGAFECVPDGGDFSVKLSSTGGVSFGPKIEVGGFDTEAGSIDGTASLTIPVTDSRPYTFEAQGTGKIVDFPVSQQTLKYTSPATVKLTGGLDITAGGYGAQLTYGEGTFVSPDAFNIEAAGSASLFGFSFGAQAVFSNTGFAVCMGEPDDRIGFGKQWGGELTAFVVCDVGPFRTPAPAGAAQTGRRSFTIGKGRPLTVIGAQGAGAPPKVVVTGPGGARVKTPAGPGGVSKRKTVLLVQDPARNTTFVVLFKPAAGRWTVTAAGGSSRLRRVRVARGLPPLRIAAKVRRRGARRVLSWNVKGLAGQRLQFVERSGGAANPLATTRRRSGALRFTPDPRLGARRAIEAIAFNRGMPRSSTTVARYRVAPPPRPKRVRRLRIEKRVLRWRAQPQASRYLVALTLPDGTTRSLTARRARLKLSGLPKGRLRVSIIAVNARGETGPVKNARFTLR